LRCVNLSGLANACRDTRQQEAFEGDVAACLLALELVIGTTAMTVPSGRLTHPPTTTQPAADPSTATLLHLPTLAATAGQLIGTARAQLR
jgi:hypothetical protein